jgi:hypothetical protein
MGAASQNEAARFPARLWEGARAGMAPIQSKGQALPRFRLPAGVEN